MLKISKIINYVEPLLMKFNKWFLLRSKNHSDKKEFIFFITIWKWKREKFFSVIKNVYIVYIGNLIYIKKSFKLLFWLQKIIELF